MNEINRRQLLKAFAISAAGLMVPKAILAEPSILVGKRLNVLEWKVHRGTIDWVQGWGDSITQRSLRTGQLWVRMLHDPELWGLYDAFDKDALVMLKQNNHGVLCEGRVCSYEAMRTGETSAQRSSGLMPIESHIVMTMTAAPKVVPNGTDMLLELR